MSVVIEEQNKISFEWLKRLIPNIWLPLTLLAVTLIAYWPALRGTLLWDDEAHITRPGLQSISGLIQIWFHLGATQQYYPVLHSAFWLEHHLWGDATLGYHLVNVFLHALAACLFAMILSKLAVRGAWVAAFLFALHPVSVESVAWISEQKNTLSAVFYLLAMLLYLHHDEEMEAGGPVFTPLYWRAFALFAAAIFSKSVTVTLPAALLVILWWKRGKLSWNRDVFPLLPWFGLGIAGGLFTAWVERRYVGATGPDFALSTVQRALIAGRAVWFYLAKLVVPANLMFIYPRWDVSARVWWQYLFPAAAIGLAGALWLFRKRNRGPLAAFLFFAGTLFPALGFFNAYPFIYSFVADHFQYLASLGIIALAASLLQRYAGKWATAVAVLPIGIFGALTWVNAATYHDSEKLYSTTIQRNRNCWMCFNNLGQELQRQGRLADATELYAAALRVKPDYAEAENNVGTLFSLRHQLPQATARFEQALKLKPNYADAENNLGNVLLVGDRPKDAIPHLEKALQLRPDYPEAKFNIGVAFLKTDRVADAITSLKDAVRMKPNYAEAHGLLGVAFYLSGDLLNAKTEYEQALRLNPKYTPPHRDLAETLWELGDVDGSISQFEIALKSDPTDNEVRHSLAKVYVSKGRAYDAVKLYEELLRQKPEQPDLHNDVALAYEALKLQEPAAKEFREAIRLKPDYADAHYNLGLLLVAMGRQADGIAEFKATLKTDPNNAIAHDALGAALYQSGRFSEAVTELSESLRLKPDLPGVRENLELAKRAAATGKAQ